MWLTPTAGARSATKPPFASSSTALPPTVVISEPYAAFDVVTVPVTWIVGLSDARSSSPGNGDVIATVTTAGVGNVPPVSDVPHAAASATSERWRARITALQIDRRARSCRRRW